MIKKVYMILLKENFKFFYDIAISLDFEGKYLRTFGFNWSFELYSDFLQ
jgi:hypothetical protein